MSKTTLLAAIVIAATLMTAAAVAAAPATLASPAACAWHQPGHDPFMGDVVAAIDRYQDIPAAVRQRLQARMARHDYDEIVSIRRDTIDGSARYGAEIRDMHFGSGQVCASVDRSAWTPSMQERGLVYCEADHCILVPTVCRNVSRISRIHREAPAATGGGGAQTPGAAVADADPAALATDQVAAAGAPGADTVTAAGALAAPRGSWIDAASAVPQGAAGTAALPTLGGPVAGSDPAGAPPLVSWPAGTQFWGDVPVPSTPVPEPGSWSLMLAGLLGLVGYVRRRAGARRINPA